jgi:hypothetical protein
MSDIIRVTIARSGPQQLTGTVHSVHPDLLEVDSLAAMLRRRTSPRREQILRAYALGLLIDRAIVIEDRRAVAGSAGAEAYAFLAEIQRADAEDATATSWPESDTSFEPDVVLQFVRSCAVTTSHKAADYRACHLVLDVELTSERWATLFAGASWATAFNLALIG